MWGKLPGGGKYGGGKADLSPAVELQEIAHKEVDLRRQLAADGLTDEAQAEIAEQLSWKALRRGVLEQLVRLSYEGLCEKFGVTPTRRALVWGWAARSDTPRHCVSRGRFMERCLENEGAFGRELFRWLQPLLREK